MAPLSKDDQLIQDSLSQGRGSEALAFASETGNLAQVEKLLATKSGVDPSFDDFSCFKLACQNHHLQVCLLLLKDPRIDPFSEKGFAFKFAAQNGSLDIIKLFLDNTKVAGDLLLSGARLARKGNHQELVKLLDPQDITLVDPKKVNGIASEARAKSGKGWEKGGDVFQLGPA
jgi:hypothetical protein